MATPEDLSANADYIRMADQYVEVGVISLTWNEGNLAPQDIRNDKMQG